MIIKELEVKKEGGLTAKDAQTVVQHAMRHDSDIFFEWKNRKINAKSLMGIISMTLSRGDKFMVIIKGDDQDEAAEDMAQLFTKDFR